MTINIFQRYTSILVINKRIQMCIDELFLISELLSMVAIVELLFVCNI